MCPLVSPVRAESDTNGGEAQIDGVIIPKTSASFDYVLSSESFGEGIIISEICSRLQQVC